MECELKTFTHSMLLFFLLILGPHLIISSHSKSIVTNLPGYDRQLPFTLETGYVGVGKNEDAQFFYMFVESERNPKEDPIIFHLTGGPGCSAIFSFFYNIGPLYFNFDNGPGNITLTSNPNSWTKMASVIFVDMPIGTGYSYAATQEGWTSSDSILAKQANEFLRKFLINHPKFMRNPLYISATSYTGIITPIVALDLYNGNERNEQPMVNIQGYILAGPLTDKFMDFNSRVEFAHRTALISDDIYKSAVKSCNGNYVNTKIANSECANSLQRYQECISKIDVQYILDPFCEMTDIEPYCREYYHLWSAYWANNKSVQKALNVREGTFDEWVLINSTIHYLEGKSDTSAYAYDIFSSFSYHQKLVEKNCRGLIYSGDHDMVFPYMGIQQWINDLHLPVQIPWKPFYVNNQVGGYEMTYAQNNFSLTFATIKGAGHSVPVYKPEESMALTKRWLDSKTYLSDM